MRKNFIHGLLQFIVVLPVGQAFAPSRIDSVKARNKAFDVYFLGKWGLNRTSLKDKSDSEEVRNEFKDDEQQDEIKERVKYSSARSGGRAKKPEREAKSLFEGASNPFIKLGTTLLAGVLFLKVLGALLFGGSSYVYYESSIYQTTTTSIDGKVETTRRESFKSNIPALKESIEARVRDGEYASK